MSDAATQDQAMIGSEWQEDVLVLKPVGRLDSNNAGPTEEVIIGHVDQGAQRVALDLSELQYISSAGLRVLLVTAKKLKGAGGQMVICGLRPNVREVLEISGFLTILQVCDGRIAALSKLSAA